MALPSAAPGPPPHRGRSVRALTPVRQIINRRLTNPPAPHSGTSARSLQPSTSCLLIVWCPVPASLVYPTCSPFVLLISCLVASCHSLHPTLRVSPVGLKELSNRVWFARPLQTALRSSRRHLQIRPASSIISASPVPIEQVTTPFTIRPLLGPSNTGLGGCPAGSTDSHSNHLTYQPMIPLPKYCISAKRWTSEHPPSITRCARNTLIQRLPST